ncbi:MULTISPECIES: DUF6274 family protein [unclassified Streptomyces]|uniref:DUF6274 family protein n=1 Tax=unclassified Streptomyces TaxID=2593676 RepID=UPI00367473DD
MATSARHETRALLRAHLAAASSYGHLTRHCPVCHRLLRLVMDASPCPADADGERGEESVEDERPRSA